MNNFCRSRLLLDVPVQFYSDEFNLEGLDSLPDICRDAGEQAEFDCIIDFLINTHEEDDENEGDLGEATPCQQRVLMHVHQRYAMSRTGQRDMRDRQARSWWGECPRHHCSRFGLLPYGPSSSTGQAGLYGFCPKCKQIYKLTS